MHGIARFAIKKPNMLLWNRTTSIMFSSSRRSIFTTIAIAIDSFLGDLQHIVCNILYCAGRIFHTNLMVELTTFNNLIENSSCARNRAAGRVEHDGRGSILLQQNCFFFNRTLCNYIFCEPIKKILSYTCFK